jgi:hypothetical protein
MMPSPFAVNQGPRFCSTPLWSSCVQSLNPILIFAPYTFAISDCVFILCCLCSLIRLQEKVLLARSIELCLVDNQWSSEVTVAGVRIASD